MRKYLWKIKGYIVGGLLFYIIEAVLTSAILAFPGLLVDNFTKGVKYVKTLVLFYVVIFSVFLVEEYISNRISDYRRVRFDKAIKMDFFDSIISKNYKDFHKYDIAEYISMQSTDISELCQNYLNPWLSIIRSFLLILIFGISLIILVDVRVAIVIILFSFVVVLIPKTTAAKLAKRNNDYLSELGQYTSRIKNLYESHDILDTAGRSKISGVQKKKLDLVYAKNMSFRKINSLSMVINGGAVEFVSVITFAVVAYLLYKNTISVGMATIAFTYSTKFMEPMHELNVCLGKVHSIKLIKKKLLSIIEPETVMPKPSTNVEVISNTRIVKKYDDTTLFLPEAKLEYPKKYLVTGKNGTGKSTFLKVLMQFEEVEEGKILYGGEENVDITDYICYMPQTPIVFDASYEDNITVFNTCDDAKMHECEANFPKEIINNIKANSDIQTLSGGEKQVLALLRALYGDKKIVLMDEPFASMDQNTKTFFVSRMRHIDKLFVIVAHDLDDMKEYFDEEFQIARETVKNPTEA